VALAGNTRRFENNSQRREEDVGEESLRRFRGRGTTVLLVGTVGSKDCFLAVLDMSIAYAQTLVV